MEAGDIAAVANLDTHTVQRALRPLGTEPFFAKEMETAKGDIRWFGRQWPSQKPSLID